MPRLGELLELSREHHAALILARDAGHVSLAASRDEVKAMNQRIADYWQTSMAAHFRHEEALLLRYPQVLPAACVMRLLDEHRVLAAISIRAVGGGLDVMSIRDFGKRLGAHVRFEERECFDTLQSVAEAVSS